MAIRRPADVGTSPRFGRRSREVRRGSLNVRFAPKATEWLRRREMRLRANRRLNALSSIALKKPPRHLTAGSLAGRWFRKEPNCSAHSSAWRIPRCPYPPGSTIS